MAANEGQRVLGDIATRLLGMHEKQSLGHTGLRECPSRKLSSSLFSSEDLAGGQAGRQHPRRRLSESNLVTDRDDVKNSTEAWRRRHAWAPRHPCKLEDIAEAGPHGPYVLLLIPLKLRDGKEAFSSYRLPLASILLASGPKETRPPSSGVGRGRRREALQARGRLEARAERIEEEMEFGDPYL
jgi:hypothetical protein